MADFVINSISTQGTAARTSDALGVSYTLANRPEFKAAISSPQQREEFVKGIKIRQEMALAGGNKTMYDVLSSLLNFTKNGSADIIEENATTGKTFDTNRLFP